jgi:hypothetical protein
MGYAQNVTSRLGTSTRYFVRKVREEATWAAQQANGNITMQLNNDAHGPSSRGTYQTSSVFLEVGCEKVQPSVNGMVSMREIAEVLCEIMT